MTKKERFVLNNIVKKGTVSFWDNKKQKILNASHSLDLLNELADENDHLKRTLSVYSDATRNDMMEIKELMQDIEEIQKENEQLRKENQKLESLWEDKCIREYTKIVGEYALEEMHKEKYGDKE